jgi:hypothetical protein
MTEVAAMSLADARNVGTIGPVETVHRGVIGTIVRGHWETIQVPVPITILSNGAETSLLILSTGAAYLPPGVYTLLAVLDRDRWSASTEADPEQHYHDSASLIVSW